MLSCFLDGSTSTIAIGVLATASFIIIATTLLILVVVTLILWKKVICVSLIFHQKCSYLLLQCCRNKGDYSFSGVVPRSPSPSETNDLESCSNASGSRLMSDDGGTKQKKDGHAEGEAKPPRSLKSSLDRGINFSTPPQMSKQKGMYTDVELSTSGVQPPIPEDSIVQYQEIDIRTTHVS